MMQYESELTRDELINLAIKQYFGSVDRKDITGTLSCFHDEAILCTQTSFTRHVGKSAIERMFTDFFASSETIVHRDFICTVDEKNGRIAACFTADLTDSDGHVISLTNTNFWRVRGSKFQEVYIYMSGENVLI